MEQWFINYIKDDVFTLPQYADYMDSGLEFSMRNTSMYAKKILEHIIERAKTEEIKETSGFGNKKLIPVFLGKEDFEEIFASNYNVFVCNIENIRNELNGLSLNLEILRDSDLNKITVDNAPIEKSEPWLVSKERVKEIELLDADDWRRFNYEIPVIESVVWDNTKNDKALVGTIFFLNPQIKTLEQISKFAYESLNTYLETETSDLNEDFDFHINKSLKEDFIDEATKEWHNYSLEPINKIYNCQLPTLSQNTKRILKYIFCNVADLGKNIVIFADYEFEHVLGDYSLNKIKQELEEAKIEITDKYQKKNFNCTLKLIDTIGKLNYDKDKDYCLNKEKLAIHINPILLSEEWLLKLFLEELDKESEGKKKVKKSK